MLAVTLWYLQYQIKDCYIYTVVIYNVDVYLKALTLTTADTQILFEKGTELTYIKR